MDTFKTDVLRKKEFQKKVLTGVLNCGLCQKTACEDFHCKFLVSCKFCREKQCKACKKFNIAKDVLFKSLDDTAKEYVKNFIREFLSLSPESLQEHYHVATETDCIPKETWIRYKHELCKYKQNKQFHLYVQYSKHRGKFKKIGTRY